MILYGSDSADYQKTHHNIYRDGSVSYSTLSVQGLHTNGADHRNQTNVLKKNQENIYSKTHENTANDIFIPAKTTKLF